MRKSAIYIFAAAAVVIGLVSCSKEKLPETESEKVQEKEQEKEQDKPQQGLRTLTVSFAAGTKTTLGPKDQPVWAEGDKISLNGVDYYVPEEAYGQSSCTITTDITGTINAVYPADAYKAQSPYYEVSDQQDGSFGSANICYAQVGSGETTIRFNNVTAVFEVEVPAHTKELVVTSLGEIDATTGQRGTTVRPINSTGSNDAAKQKITVTVTDSSSPTTCYVSVMVDGTNPVLLTNLNFDAVTSETTGAQGGVSPNYIKSKGQDPLEYKAAAGTIYTPVLHEYVVVGEGENARKWATMNVGATSETEAGYYFFWGGIKGYKHNGSNWVEADVTPENVLTDGFVIGNDPYYDNTNSKYTKYTGTSGDNKSVLDLADDAANVNWGGAWRMPTQEELGALSYLETKSWETDYNHSGVSGKKFTDAGNSIFLPAAGCVDDKGFIDGNGYYWSSSLNAADNPNNASCLLLGSSATYTSYFCRYHGRSVRALSE